MSPAAPSATAAPAAAARAAREDRKGEAGAASPLRGMLPILQALSLVALGTQVVAYAGDVRLSEDAEVARSHAVVAGAYATVLVVIAGCWIVRLRTASARVRARCSILAAVMCLALIVLGTIGLGVPTLVLCVALLVLDASPRAGIVGAAIPVTLTLVLHVVAGAGPGALASNILFLGALLLFGLALGMSWRAFQDRRDRDRELLAQRDEALGRLEAAMERLRRAADTEKELVLSDERTRAARDLHDGLGHRLTLISMSLEFAERMRDREPEAAWAEVAAARGTAVEAMDEMRTWVRALSPVRDADATGLAAFDAIAESFRGTGLAVTVSRHGPSRSVALDEGASLLLYRAVQEGLTNALRHGRARSAAIDVIAGEGEVRLRLTSDLDQTARDGLGEGPLPRGFGLRGLAERAEALGGSAAARREGDRVVLDVVVPADVAPEAEAGPSASAAASASATVVPSTPAPAAADPVGGLR